MIRITQAQQDALEAHRLLAFVPRLDLWLAEVLPAWAKLEVSPRRAELADMLKAAHRAGLEVEIDYALFAWSLASIGREWRKFLEKRETREVIEPAEWSARAKVMRLHELVTGHRPAVEA